MTTKSEAITPVAFELGAIDGLTSITVCDAEACGQTDDCTPVISFAVKSAANNEGIEVLTSKDDCVDLVLFLFGIINEWAERTLKHNADESYIDGLRAGLGSSEGSR